MVCMKNGDVQYLETGQQKPANKGQDIASVAREIAQKQRQKENIGLARTSFCAALRVWSSASEPILLLDAPRKAPVLPP